MPNEMHQTEVGGARDKRLFSPAEFRLFRCTAVMLSLVVLIALTGLIVWSFGWMLSAFYNLLLALSVAGILALVLHPVVEFLERRLHFPAYWPSVFCWWCSLRVSVACFSCFSLPWSARPSSC